MWDRWPRRHFLSSRDTRENKNFSFAVLSTSQNESADVPSMRKKCATAAERNRTVTLSGVRAKIPRKGKYAENSHSFIIKINIQKRYIARKNLSIFYNLN